MDPFARLAEGCISEILSFTSALDASRSSMVSKEFKSAADNDVVWERFLPQDYQDIISTSVYPLKHATKKELYFSLCHSPPLIHGGNMSFSLDKRNGKKCFMVGARELLISWKGCWDFMSHNKSRMDGLKSLNTVIRFLNDKSQNNTSKLEQFESRQTGKIAQIRGDGWLEMEMGKFYNGFGDDAGEVEAWLIETNGPHEKSGLLVEGIEFRPV